MRRSPSPSPSVEEVAQRPSRDHGTPAPSRDHGTPAPSVEEVAQRPSRDHGTPAPSVEEVAQRRSRDHGTPAPSVEEVAQRPSRDHGTTLITVAHGTRNAAGNLVAAEITAAAGNRLGMRAVASYVELCEPLVADVVAGLGGPAVVVPLLLSTGYHVRHDLPAAVAGTRDVELGGPLGPDPLLAAAQVDRLVEAGAVAGQPVVMVAAGSTDPAATADLAEAARLLSELWGAPARLATLAGLGARPADVVQPGDVVSPYLLAPGFFGSRARGDAIAAGASAVASVIGAHPRVVDLVCQRASRLAPPHRP